MSKEGKAEFARIVRSFGDGKINIKKGVISNKWKAPQTIARTIDRLPQTTKDQKTIKESVKRFFRQDIGFLIQVRTKSGVGRAYIYRVIATEKSLREKEKKIAEEKERVATLRKKETEAKKAAAKQEKEKEKEARRKEREEKQAGIAARRKLREEKKALKELKKESKRADIGKIAFSKAKPTNTGPPNFKAIDALLENILGKK
mgnify:CR=1 FL=1